MPGQPLLIFFLFSLLLVNTDTTHTCPPPNPDGVYSFCSASTLYVFDTSGDLPVSQILAEFNYTRYNILPITDWQDRLAWVSFSLYGSDGNWNSNFTNQLKSACSDLDFLESIYELYGNMVGSFLDILEDISNKYRQLTPNTVIYTGSKDTLDIKDAANYARSYMSQWNLTVIALNGALIDEANFPATVYHVQDLNNPPFDLNYCVMWRSCGLEPNCTINENVRPTTGSTTRSTPSSFPTTSQTPSTCATTTTVGTTTTPLSTIPSNLQCQCNTMYVWVDMIFVIDASASTGESGLDEMWGMAATMLELFNVQKTSYTASNYTSRVGVITYGNTADVIYPLGSLDNDMINNLFGLPFNNDPMTNLEAGLQAAIAQFNGPNHRSNARRIIIVMAAAFDPEGANAPFKTASTFKEDGGILMVYNYVPEGGVDSPTLSSLASPGYFFSTALNSRNSDMALGLCDANCFCRDNLHPYGLSDPRRYPTKGCYIVIAANSNYARARNSCKVYYFNGTVTTDEDLAKTAFLKTLFHSNNAFYIGLTYDNINRSWEWPDGTAPGSYQPWVGGKIPEESSEQCVYLDSNSRWQPVDCRNSFSFVCEIRPCDSVHYCA